jgi:signal transduction histidine kinase
MATNDRACVDEGQAPADIGRLAHELRTPLAAISVLAEIMRDERLGPLGSPRYRGYAADIHLSAAHATAVLASWLETAAGGSSRLATLDYVEIEPGGVIAAAISALRPLAEASGVKLSVATSTGLPRLIVDQRSLLQCLNNLVANAVKFTAPGGSIDVTVTHARGHNLDITVRDTGDGMTASELARARSAELAPSALRRRSGGTGYGLPLVHSLAATMGAQLQIESNLGQGTSARLSFPAGRLVPV